MTVSVVRPVFNGELAENVNINPPSRRITFDEVREVGREGADIPEAFQKVRLVLPGGRVRRNSKTSMSTSSRQPLAFKSSRATGCERS